MSYDTVQDRFAALTPKRSCSTGSYRRRKSTVEPVFGQIQVRMGFRRFFYRGRMNVGSEWNLVCAALNVKKMAARMQKSRGWCVLARIVDYIRSLGHLIYLLRFLAARQLEQSRQ